MDADLISKKIRELRKKRKCSLAELAKRSDVSKSYLSKIENEKNIPSLAIMRRIGDALDVDSTYFMTDDAATEDFQLSPAAERKLIPFGVGPDKYFQAPLAQNIAGRTMDPYYVEVPHDDDSVYQYEGDRFYIILEGKVRGMLGGKPFVGEAGDSIYLNEGVPHTSRSVSKNPAKVLMISSMFRRLRYTLPFSDSVDLPTERRQKKKKR